MYNIIKKLIFCSIISLSISYSLLSFDITKDTTIAKEIIITGTRTPVTYQESGRSLDLINKSQISNAVSQNIEVLLKNQSIIDLRQRGASGATSDLGIRGGNHDQTLVMLNGIKMSDMQTGHHNLDLPIDLESINKIEILAGGASRVLGPNAFAGAVNFITNSSRDFYSNIKLSGGSNSFYGIALNANIPISDAGIFLSFNKKKSDGYIANTDYDLINLYSTIDYQSKIGNFYLDLGYNQKDFGANSFYSAAYPDQFEATSAKFSALRYSWGNEFRVNANLYFREHNDRYELFRHGVPAPAWYKNPNYHQTRTYGYEVKTAYDYALGTTSIGFEYRNENLLSNNIGTPLSTEDYKDVPNEKGAVFTKSGVRNSANVYLEHNANIGDLSISGGLLFNKTSAYDANIYPGIDLSYKLTDKFSLFTSYNKSLRFPSFTDLYYNIKTQVGDPNLKPEESHTIEFGGKYYSNALRLTSSVYYRNGKNMIDWVKEIQNGVLIGDKYKSMNIAEINALGFEFSAALNIMELWSSQKFFSSAAISYAYIDMRSKDVGHYVSAYVLDNLRHKITGSLGFVLPFETALNIDMCYEDRNGQYARYENKKEVGLAKYEPHFLMNTRISKDLYNFTLGLEVYNIFNKQYVDIGNLLQPGRDIRVIFGYKFK